MKKLAFNSSLIVGFAANAAPLASGEVGESEWLLLAPYGDHPLQVQVGKEWKTLIQRLNAETAANMVKGFNSTLAKIGRLFRGLPVYVGHPDGDPVRWPDEKRLGGVSALEAREDGLYCQVAWNSAGRENRKEGYYVFPSGAWYYDETKALATGIILPESLGSVGLTNNPNIGGVAPWTNSRPATASLGVATVTTPNTELRAGALARLSKK